LLAAFAKVPACTLLHTPLRERSGPASGLIGRTRSRPICS
jgi:hypothetical protein